MVKKDPEAVVPVLERRKTTTAFTEGVRGNELRNAGRRIQSLFQYMQKMDESPSSEHQSRHRGRAEEAKEFL